MIQIPNKKLTDNFSLYELIESSLPPKALQLNWRYIHEFEKNYDKWERLADHLQKLRNIINLEFRSGNGGREIGIRLTSGFRCREWELMRNRTGNSQHTVGAAADIQPINCSQRMSIDIMYWLWKKHWPKDTGYCCGFAIKKPIYTQGGIIETIGFLHYDLRENVARWEY